MGVKNGFRRPRLGWYTFSPLTMVSGARLASPIRNRFWPREPTYPTNTSQLPGSACWIPKLYWVMNGFFRSKFTVWSCALMGALRSKFAMTFGNGGLGIVVRVVNGGFRLPEKK